MMASARTFGLGLAWIALVFACGGGGGGSGGDETCRPESDASLCASASAECGAASAIDRCGTVRVLDCGGCDDPLWCGGGGEPNRCGATCPVGCPEGWTCELGVCTGGDRTGIVLDLETVRVGGNVLLGGVAPTVAPDCYDYTTVVSFRDAVTGATASALIPCEARDFAFETELAPGTYAVSVSKYREDSNLPDGVFVVERALEVTGARDDLVLDLRTVTVAGRLTLEGAAPVAALDCYDFTTSVTFSDVITGTSAYYLIPCDSRDFTFQLPLPPGIYAVSVSKYRALDSNLPDGTFVVEPALRIDGPASGLVLDLRTVEVAGRLTWNGAVPEASVDCYDYTTVVYFSERETGTSASALIPCDAEDFSFRLPVAPGTYSVSISKYRNDDSNLPDGSFVVAPALRVDGPVDGLVLDLQTVRAQGHLRWNGAVPRASAGCYDYTAVVHFAETIVGGSATALVPCASSDFSFDLAVPPGTYAVSVWKYRSEDSNLPDGTFVVNRALRIDGSTTGLALEFQTVRVAGTVTVNGRAPTVAPDCYDYTASVSFRESRLPGSWQEALVADTSISTLIPCSSRTFAWAAEVPPGDYLIGVSAYRSDSSSLPDGNFAAVNRLAVR